MRYGKHWCNFINRRIHLFIKSVTSQPQEQLANDRALVIAYALESAPPIHGINWRVTVGSSPRKEVIMA